MIKIVFSKLKNGNLEITEDMLNEILSYMKRQENYIIDDLLDIIAESLDVNTVEKRFSISIDDFKIWIKEK